MAGLGSRDDKLDVAHISGWAFPSDVMGEAKSDPYALGRITPLIGLIVALVIGSAWYVTWVSSDLVSAIMAVPFLALNMTALLVFFSLITVMMVAMMLPSALPMIMTFHGLTRGQASGSTMPGKSTGTIVFASAYFLVWGAFGVLALLGLTELGLMGPMSGWALVVPGAVLVGAGAYQLVQAKEVCLHHCQTPFSFVMTHWRSGRSGALRMGLRHASYCLGCCWMFMIVLFVTGTMSLFWMGGISVAIFLEKVVSKQLLLSRIIGVLLLVVGGLVLGQTFLF